MYTGFRIKEESFDESEEKIIDGVDSTFTTADVARMNRELRKIKNRIRTQIRYLERSTESFTVEDVLAQYIRKKVRQQFYLLRYIDTQIDRKRH